MKADFILASICLSDIPKELIKDVTLKDGVTRKKFLSVKIVRRKEKGQYGDTHFISCEPKDKELRRDGVSYIIGNGKEWEPTNKMPSVEEAGSSPSATGLDLPF